MSAENKEGNVQQRMPLIACEPNPNLYPNLSAILAGCVSGPSSEWPAIRAELRGLCGALCAEIEDRERSISDATKERDVFRAVLEAFEFRDLDGLARRTIEDAREVGAEGCRIAKHAVNRSIEAQRELHTLRELFEGLQDTIKVEREAHEQRGVYVEQLTLAASAVADKWPELSKTEAMANLRAALAKNPAPREAPALAPPESVDRPRREEAGLRAAYDAILPLGAGDFSIVNDHDAGFMRGVEACALKIAEMIEALPPNPVTEIGLGTGSGPNGDLIGAIDEPLPNGKVRRWLLADFKAAQEDARRYRALRDNEKVRAAAFKRDGHYYVIGLESGRVLDERIDVALHGVGTAPKA